MRELEQRAGGGGALALAQRVEASAEVYEAVRVLFLRAEQLQGADRVAFTLTPGKGTEYTATVRLEQAVRGSRAEHPGERTASATGPDEARALRALADLLAARVRERIKADVGALQLAGYPLGPEFFGEGWGRHVAHAPPPGAGGVVETTGEEVPASPHALPPPR